MSTRTAVVESGAFAITDLDRHSAIELMTTKRGERTTGLASFYEVRGSGFEVEIADIKFDNGTRDIRMTDRRTCKAFDRLMHGLRVGVHQSHGKWFVQLGIPAVGSRGTVTRHQTNVEDLERTCHLDVVGLLRSAGATTVNRRALAIGDRGPTRNQLCVTFESEYSAVPAVAYAITPVLAFSHLFL